MVQRVNVPEIGLDQALAVARDAQNNLYITGYNEKLGNKNIQTVKLNPSFGLEWVRTFDAEGMEDVAKAVGCDADGNVYLAGHSTTNQDGETFRILKYNSQGDELWNKTYKPRTCEGARAVDLKVMPTGEFYVSGTTTKTGAKDFVTLKYNSDGEIVWEKQFDGLQADEVTTIKADENGNVYVSGISSDANQKQYTTVKYTHFKPVRDLLYRSNGRPWCAAQELVLKLKPSEVNPQFVNDGDWMYGNAEAILSDSAITQLEAVLPFPLRNNDQITFSKIFTELKTTDTISISRLGERIPIPTFWSVLLFHFPNDVDINTIKNQLNGLFPLVEYCHVNAVCHKSSIPNDPYINGPNHRQSSLVPNNTYPYAHINMDSAWNITTGGGSRKIKVGVYDDPIYWKHPDFGGPIFSQTVIKGGENFHNNIDIENVNIPNENHGTFVAGLIGAMRNNGIGIAGIAGGDIARRDTGVYLYSMGIFKDSLLTYTSNVANAIAMGTLNGLGIQIQNHSWGTDEDSAFVLRTAIRNAFINKTVIVGARGNRGNTWKEYPACFPDEWVINVGSAGNNGQFKTRFNSDISDRQQSSFGAGIDLIAPGGFDNVYTMNSPGFRDICGSPFEFPYSCFHGTSSAAAHVSGTAALMLSLHNTSRGYPNDLAPDDVEHILSKYATDVEDIADVDVYDVNQVFQRTETVLFERGYDKYNGWGLLNAGAALRMINMPKYHIWHPIVNATLSQRAISTRSVTLKENVNGINARLIPYTMTTYEVTEKYNIKLANHLRLIDAWKRVSSSKGYKDTTVLYDDPWVDFTSRVSSAADGDTVFVEMKSYYYQIGSTSSWLPQSPGVQGKFKFSLHLENKNAVPTSEITNKDYPIKIYPNPTTGTLSLAFQGAPLEKSLQATLFDMTGRLVQRDEWKHNEQGIFTLNLQSLVQGTYMLRLEGMSSIPLYYKIVKL